MSRVRIRCVHRCLVRAVERLREVDVLPGPFALDIILKNVTDAVPAGWIEMRSEKNKLNVSCTLGVGHVSSDRVRTR